MKPADIASQRSPGAPTLSPDGRTAVVALSRPDLEKDDYTSQLWTVATDGSTPPRLLTYGSRDSGPRFSPDGQWIAFVRAVRDVEGPLGKAQLYVLPAAGGEARRLTDHPLGVDEPVWSPDSQRLAYAARVPEEGRYGTKSGTGAEAEPPRRITKLFYRIDDVGFMLDRPRHVFVVDVPPGDVPAADLPTPAQVTDGPYDHGEPAWSPDGRLLTLVAARHETWFDDIVTDVWVCQPDGSGLRALTDSTFAVAQPKFTPDSAAVCFTGLPADSPPVSSELLWRVPVSAAGGPPERLTDPARHQVAYPGAYIQPADDGVLFISERRGSTELLLVPYDGGEPEVLLGGDRQIMGVDRQAGVLVATIADATTWGELHVGDRQLTNWNSDVDALPMEEVTATAPDGYPVHGWVVRPAGPGPHPVLLMIHGGPYTQYGWRLFDEPQVYAGAGYAVVYGNPRGSSGYGQEHGQSIIGRVGPMSEQDLMALLDQALKSDDLDGTRVGVLGGSHGGFMTTWLAAHQGDRFKAAVSERAVNAVDSFVGSSDIGWFFADRLWSADPAQSPITHVDRIKIPVLIVHSEHDWRCPVEQAQRLFVALKHRGTPVELLLFPGEGHEMSRSGRPSHRVARFEAILEWFGRWL
jgi:dipeptidyl aminopeptidase/acylaminoacyl peptidase